MTPQPPPTDAKEKEQERSKKKKEYRASHKPPPQGRSRSWTLHARNSIRAESTTERTRESVCCQTRQLIFSSSRYATTRRKCRGGGSPNRGLKKQKTKSPTVGVSGTTTQQLPPFNSSSDKRHVCVRERERKKEGRKCEETNK